MRILVTGSRDWADGAQIETAIIAAARDLNYAGTAVTVVHGGARGADSIAESVARKYGMQVECHPAAWDTRGRAAGIIRNSEMVNAGADICLAFIKNGSRGATHCANAAEKAGIHVRRYEESPLCDVPGCDQVAVELLANDASLASPDYREWRACRWHRRNPTPPAERKSA